MPVQVCSLILSEPQSIPGDGKYHILRFPFGSEESADDCNMHQMAQPDGYTISNWRTDDRSGLIWPACDGWGSLTGVIFWAAGDYTEIRDQFVRDPFNLSTGFNSTATEDHSPTTGGQYLHKSHELFVHPGTPIGLLVKHNASGPVDVTFAEFKLAIHT
ncbi:hypothetical protein [Streptomyces sp. 1222.5]|uniref:hypothetical protein n=1 Tax=Streptomyces sp. 1222.5 TaxID=1881026 RepID=UPI003D75AA36